MDIIPSLMTHAADALLVLASLGAAVFCMVLSRRLSRLSSIDNGLGGAIAVLSAQVDEMNKALTEMKSGTQSSAQQLAALNREARQLAEDLELMLSACHDLDQPVATDTPEPESDDQPEDAFCAELTPIFGSRRLSALDTPDDPSIPLFLKQRSRIAGAG